MNKEVQSPVNERAEAQGQSPEPQGHSPEAQDIAEKLAALQTQCHSLMLSTLDREGNPCVSYAPFVQQGDAFYIFISALAAHTQQLQAHPRAQVMLIQDEAQTTNIFARARAIFHVEAQRIPSEAPDYEPMLDHLQARHGNTMKVLRGLADFMLFRLSVVQGSVVLGFGRAYVFERPSQILNAVQLTSDNLSDYR